MTASLYKTEAEIAGLVGLSTDDWKHVADVLEKRGLPRKMSLFGNRRYWPAVKAWLDRDNGLMQDAPPLARDGEENHHYEPPRKQRARA